MAYDPEYYAKWRAKNKEKIRAYNRKYWDSHKDDDEYCRKKVEYHKVWRDKNREHYREYQREYQREYRNAQKDKDDSA